MSLPFGRRQRFSSDNHFLHIVRKGTEPAQAPPVLSPFELPPTPGLFGAVGRGELGGARPIKRAVFVLYFGQSGRARSCPTQRAISCCASVAASRGTVPTARFDAARSRAALRRSARLQSVYLYVGEGRRKPSQAPKFSSSPPEPSSLLSLAVRTSR